MYDNNVEYILEANFALFSDPIPSMGGEKISYPIPTVEALKNITGRIYKKPTFLWVIDEIKVLNRIDYECKGIKKRKQENNGNDLSYYTYLKNVKYYIKAHFEWNFNFPEYESDRNPKKHREIFERSLKRGGRLPIFAGTSECPAFVRPVGKDDLKSVYDDINLIPFGFMYHSKGYPNENPYGEKKLYTYFQNVEMRNGIIKFKETKDCKKRFIKNYEFRTFEKKLEALWVL